MSRRAENLAQRIEEGARALATLAEGLSEAEWGTVVQPDGRTVGVTVHHVANMYGIEIELAKSLAAGNGVRGVGWGDVHNVNHKHASENSSVGKKEAVEALLKNSKMAADAVRAFSDEELDRAGAVSLNSDAPLTTQFFIEDHALRHSFHHLAKIRATLKK